MSPTPTRALSPGAVPKEAVGAQLRVLRKRKGFTLKGLSKVSDVPLSTLSKIELGQAALSYDKFVAVARGLGVDMAELLQPGGQGEQIQFAGQVLKTRVNDQDGYSSDTYHLEFLFRDVHGKVMTPLVATVHSREVDDFTEFIKHPGQEFAYVLSGAVTIQFENGQRINLKRNEAAYFDSSIGHVYLTTSRTPARVLAVCSDH